MISWFNMSKISRPFVTYSLFLLSVAPGSVGFVEHVGLDCGRVDGIHTDTTWTDGCREYKSWWKSLQITYIAPRAITGTNIWVTSPQLIQISCTCGWNLRVPDFHTVAESWRPGRVPGHGKGRQMPCTISWWRHQLETFSALLAICAGNSPVPGESPAQRPVTRSFDVFFDMRPKKRLSKQSLGWWFDTPWRPLWRQRNITIILT